MKYTRCLEKLRAPLFGVLFGAVALGLSTPSAQALDVQGCIKLDGKLTKGVTVEAFDVRTCTSLLSTVTDGNGDFVLWTAAGQNRNLYLQITAPDGCIQIVDNATVCNSIVTDPSDPRVGWVALCVDMPCACVPCTTGVSKVVLQYLGTSTQVITVWGAATKTTSKKVKLGSKATADNCSLFGKPGHLAGHKVGSKCNATPVATPLFVGSVAPCTTFTIDAPRIPAPKTGSKGTKTSSKAVTTTTDTAAKSGSKSTKPSSKTTKTGSKKGIVSGLTVFVGANVNTRLDLSCLSGVQTGQVIGMFKVIRLENDLGQRICQLPRVVQTGNCRTVGKPTQMTFQFVGGNCSTAANSQTRGTKYNCTDLGTCAGGTIKIVIASSATPCLTGFFASDVHRDQTFVVRAGTVFTKSKKRKVSGFGDKTYAYIYCGGVLIERIQLTPPAPPRSSRANASAASSSLITPLRLSPA